MIINPPATNNSLLLAANIGEDGDKSIIIGHMTDQVQQLSVLVKASNLPGHPGILMKRYNNVIYYMSCSKHSPKSGVKNCLPN